MHYCTATWQCNPEGGQMYIYECLITLHSPLYQLLQMWIKANEKKKKSLSPFQKLNRRLNKGDGRSGWSIAKSLLFPFAINLYSFRETFTGNLYFLVHVWHCLSLLLFKFTCKVTRGNISSRASYSYKINNTSYFDTSKIKILTIM